MSGNKSAKTPRHAARFIAANAVKSVLQEKTALDEAISSQALFLQLSARDRAFARLMSATVMRRLGQIDAVLAQFVKKNTPAMTMAVLRCAAAQILFLQTPPHAAVNGAVAILKKSGKTAHMSGLANAVLRKIAGQGENLLNKTSTLDNIPKWLRSDWYNAYGGKNLQKMANQLVQIPPLDITVKQGGTEPNGEIIYCGKYSKTIRLKTASNIRDLPGYELGHWWVQDISAALPVRLLGNVKNRRVLDMCAAPGGKTLQFAANGAEVVALDKNEYRIKRLEENLARTGLTATCHIADALKWRDTAKNNEPGFDIVLLDAPCTATGTYRRNPDILHTKTPDDIASLARLQEKLLLAASRHLRPGGVLLFCTCSLQKQEGEAQIATFLQNRTDFRLISPLASPDGRPEYSENDGYFRILPHFLSEKGGQDGFFIAGFTRC